MLFGVYISFVTYYAANDLFDSYVQRLEERVAQLESLIPQESLDHIDGARPPEGPSPSSLDIQVCCLSRSQPLRPLT